jgi:hypothetical protein
MKIVALIGLIDEADCIGECIDHHLAIGFDKIFVTDLGSLDGSLEIVKSFEKSGRVKLLFGSQNLLEDQWPRRMLRHAIEDIHPDFIAHIDPDEFWLPSRRNIKCLKDLESADILTVTRYNAAQSKESLTTDRNLRSEDMLQQLVYVERLPLAAECPPLTPLYAASIGPKVMHKGVDLEVGLGWHNVNALNMSAPIKPEDVVILHYPLTSYKRFENKVNNIMGYFEANPHLPPALAWHWRRMVKAAVDGELQQEWEAQSLTNAEIELQLQQGKIAPLSHVHPLFQ